MRGVSGIKGQENKSKALLKQVVQDIDKQLNGMPATHLIENRNKNIELGKQDFRTYCNCNNPVFFRDSRTFQQILCDSLQKMYEKRLVNPKTGKLYNKMVINLPPGHGKSYTAGMFATWAFGQDKNNQVITVSYNQTLSTRFAKTVREMIQDAEIHGDYNYYVPVSFFPTLKIKDGDGAMNLWSLEGSYMSYLATSFSGSITGMRGNIGIIDDPIKNKYEAVSEHIKDAHWDWYKNTFLSRMVEGAIQIIIMTRWASDDLAGRIIAEYPDDCYVLEMPVLNENGEALCEEILSLEAIEDKRKGIDDEIFQANYMQQPIDKTGALYQQFRTYDVYDSDQVTRKIAYIDTADEGDDFLLMIAADEIDGYAYVTDIYYTDDPMETTEEEVSRRLTLVDTRECIIESNNGGRGFARNVEKILKTKFKNKRTAITWFHQSKKKKTRIIVAATNVQEQIIYPEGWDKKYPEYYKAMMSYQRKGKNAHDDAPDGTTGLFEFMSGVVKGKKKGKILSKRKFGL